MSDIDTNNSTDERVLFSSDFKTDRTFRHSVVCPLCSYNTEDKYLMIKHLNMHTSVNMKMSYTCRLCNATASSASAFRDHFSTHTGEFAYECAYCTFTAAHSSAVVNHTICNHSQERMKVTVIGENALLCEEEKLKGYACGGCGLIQISKRNIEKHVRSVGVCRGAAIKELEISKTKPLCDMPHDEEYEQLLSKVQLGEDVNFSLPSAIDTHNIPIGNSVVNRVTSSIQFECDNNSLSRDIVQSNESIHDEVATAVSKNGKQSQETLFTDFSSETENYFEDEIANEVSIPSLGSTFGECHGEEKLTSCLETEVRQCGSNFHSRVSDLGRLSEIKETNEKCKINFSRNTESTKRDLSQYAERFMSYPGDTEKPKVNMPGIMESSRKNSDGTECSERNIPIDTESAKRNLFGDNEGQREIFCGTESSRQDIPSNAENRKELPVDTKSPDRNLPSNAESPSTIMPVDTKSPDRNLPSNAESPSTIMPVDTKSPDKNLPSNPESPSTIMPVDAKRALRNLSVSSERPRRNFAADSERREGNLSAYTKRPKRNLAANNERPKYTMDVYSEEVSSSTKIHQTETQSSEYPPSNQRKEEYSTNASRVSKTLQSKKILEDNKIDIETTEEMQKEVTFSCGSCDFHTSNEEEFKKHPRTNHRDFSMWCKSCGKCFNNVNFLISHIKEGPCEKEDMIYHCGVKECEFQTPTGKAFISHFNSVHSDVPFIFCFHCQKIFTLPQCLIIHMQNDCLNKTGNGKSSDKTKSDFPNVDNNLKLKNAILLPTTDRAATKGRETGSLKDICSNDSDGLDRSCWAMHEIPTTSKPNVAGNIEKNTQVAGVPTSFLTKKRRGRPKGSKNGQGCRKVKTRTLNCVDFGSRDSYDSLSKTKCETDSTSEPIIGSNFSGNQKVADASLFPHKRRGKVYYESSESFDIDSSAGPVDPALIPYKTRKSSLHKVPQKLEENPKKNLKRNNENLMMGGKLNKKLDKHCDVSLIRSQQPIPCNVVLNDISPEKHQGLLHKYFETKFGVEKLLGK